MFGLYVYKYWRWRTDFPEFFCSSDLNTAVKEEPSTVEEVKPKLEVNVTEGGCSGGLFTLTRRFIVTTFPLLYEFHVG